MGVGFVAAEFDVKMSYDSVTDKDTDDITNTMQLAATVKDGNAMQGKLQEE